MAATPASCGMMFSEDGFGPTASAAGAVAAKAASAMAAADSLRFVIMNLPLVGNVAMQQNGNGLFTKNSQCLCPHGSIVQRDINERVI
jgi:ApbE superfamily uncharacterized protein (UPF0280 family)